MSTELATTSGMTAIEAAGHVANKYAAASAFAKYTAGKSDNTLDAQRTDLATFADYLCDATGGRDCPTAAQLQTDPAAWRGMTHGLVAGFAEWMLQHGYSMASINRKLSTVRVYAKLAGDAKVIDTDETTLIRGVRGYGGKEGKRVDERRKEAGQATRTGHKKAQHVRLDTEHVKALKMQPDTPQGRRDAVIMCLLLDHGLRVGELAGLPVSGQVVTGDGVKDVGVFLSRDARGTVTGGKFIFYRPKVDKVQTHTLTNGALAAVARWIDTDAPQEGLLLRGSRKGGHLTGAGMSERAITQRVTDLGEAIGVYGLSAHDCRHSWATRAATAGTDSFALRDAGGWNSLAMPSRYVESATVANERVKLD